jgi:ParB/RepB/Spo0J family partition protein
MTADGWAGGGEEQLTNFFQTTMTNNNPTTAPVTPAETAFFDLDAIRMWNNARQRFCQEGLRELADSLRDSRGSLQPPVGYRIDEPGCEVELFLGERRWRAYRLLRDEGHAEFAQMAVRVVPRPSDRELHKWHLAENLHREDLRPSETGEWLSRMMGLADEMTGNALWTMRGLAEEIGKPVSWVSLAMLLGKAPDSVRRAVDEGTCCLETGALIGTLPAGLREGAAAEMVHGPMGAMGRDQARAWVAEMYRRDLRHAEFSVEEVGLAGKPACVRCEWWGGNREDVGGKMASTTCLNPSCFLEKQREAVVLRAQEKGAQLTLWQETSTEEIWERHSGRLAPDAGFVEMGERPSPQMLDSECGDAVMMPTWGEMLRDSGVVPVVAFDPAGQAREIVGTGEALRAAASSRWGSLFRDGAVAAYLSPEERAAERAVRTAGDREWEAGLMEGLAELKRGMDAANFHESSGLMYEALRYVWRSLLKSEDLAILASVLGAQGKSVAALEEVMSQRKDEECATALMLSLVVRRVRYEGFAIFCDEDASPLDEVTVLARFEAGDWHKRLKRRREAAERAARTEEEKKMEDRARKAIKDAARGRE